MIEIVFEEEKLRTVARDGDRFVGECDCSAGSGVWTAYHTEVDPAYGGQGIAGRLVAKLAESAKDAILTLAQRLENIRANMIGSFSALRYNCNRRSEAQKYLDQAVPLYDR